MQQSPSSKFGHDFSSGSIPRGLISLALPMLIGNLMNMGYSIINLIWVGRILGPDAMGAAAVSFPLVFIFIALAAGATMATTILVSQFYGAKNFAMVEKTVNNSFTVALVFGAVLTIAGVASGDLLLRAMQTPASIFPLASLYFKVSMLGFTIIYFSFLIASILRGIGDTKTPLIFMSIGVVLNAVFDPLLIIGIGPFPRLGLVGAAIASIVSSLAAVITGFVYLNRKSHIVALRISKLGIDLKQTALLFKIGFPSMVQQSLISIGSAFVTTFVNSFGASATAAFGAAGRTENIAFMPIMTLSMAVSVMAGQNIGAQRIDRVRKIFWTGITLSLSITIITVASLVIFPRLFMSMFVKDKTVIDLGVVYLRMVGPAFLFVALLFVSNGIINGSGHTIITMIFTLVSLWAVRVPVAAWLSHTSLGIRGIWIAICASFCITSIISLSYYASGRWKKTIKGIHTPAAEIPDAILAEEPIG